MKNVLNAVVIWTLLVVFQSARAEDIEAISSMLETFLEGVDQVEVHDNFWAEDLVYTSSRGTRTTKSAILEGMRQASESAYSPTYGAEDVDIRVYGETAVLAFTLVANMPAHGDQKASVQHYLNTGTLLKREGRWQVVAWQATVKASE